MPIRILLAILTVSWLAPEVEAERLRHGRGIYYLHVPPNVEKPSVLVWLHPSAGGAKPEFDFWRMQAPSFGDEGNSILISPQAIEGAWSLRADEPFIKQVVKKVIKKYDADPGKVILGGHSAGATFAYQLGLRNQDVFHAVFPNAGRMEGRKQPPPDPAGSPLIYIFHSQNDDIIPFSQAEQARDTLRQAGYPVSFYSGQVQHNIGGPTLSIFAAMDQLLQQVDPRVVRLYGGLEGIKVLAQPKSAECFRIKSLNAEAGEGSLPDSAIIGDKTPVTGDTFAALLEALVAAEGYTPGAVASAGDGPFDTFRLAGQEAKLEVALGQGGTSMTVYLDGHRIGGATFEGASPKLGEIAQQAMGGGGAAAAGE
ncbi:MAG: hypothetical protein AAF657_23165 [Acidobacteriota bacterium]